MITTYILHAQLFEHMSFHLIKVKLIQDGSTLDLETVAC